VSYITTDEDPDEEESKSHWNSHRSKYSMAEIYCSESATWFPT